MAGLVFSHSLNYHAGVVLVLNIFVLLSGSPSPANAASVQYNVVSLGAKADGETDSSNAFQSAWALACGSTGAATIYVPQGRFLVWSASFNGPCKNSAITVCIDGTLIAPSNHNVNGYAGNWIVLRHVTGVSVIGGTLDGQGAGLWACKLSGKSCPSGATVRMHTLIYTDNPTSNTCCSLLHLHFHLHPDKTYLDFWSSFGIVELTAVTLTGFFGPLARDVEYLGSYTIEESQLFLAHHIGNAMS